MCITVYGGSANIKTNERRMERNEKLLLFCKTVIDEQVILHIEIFDQTKVSQIFNFVIREIIFTFDPTNQIFLPLRVFGFY